MSPIRVDFYLLEDESLQAVAMLACQLLEKAYHNNNKVLVCCQTLEYAKYLDELAWSYKADSFIPHKLYAEKEGDPPSVQICYEDKSYICDDILLNLRTDIPLWATQARRIIEIVANNTAAKELARAHYRVYRTREYDLNTHNIALL